MDNIKFKWYYYFFTNRKREWEHLAECVNRDGLTTEQKQIVISEAEKLIEHSENILKKIKGN